MNSNNSTVAAVNADKPEADHIAPFKDDGEAWAQINKIAYWSATGSGKTLLTHANILQYQFYLDKHGRGRELNRIILLTPNEGLSQQHLREFEAAGLAAELFQKDEIGRAHVCTPVTNAHLVCRLLIDTNKRY